MGPMPEPNAGSAPLPTGHIVTYVRPNGRFSPPVATCLICRWTCTGAAEAVKRGVERHEGRVRQNTRTEATDAP